MCQEVLLQKGTCHLHLCPSLMGLPVQRMHHPFQLILTRCRITSNCCASEAMEKRRTPSSLVMPEPQTKMCDSPYSVTVFNIHGCIIVCLTMWIHSHHMPYSMHAHTHLLHYWCICIFITINVHLQLLEVRRMYRTFLKMIGFVLTFGKVCTNLGRCALIGTTELVILTQDQG